MPDMDEFHETEEQMEGRADAQRDMAGLRRPRRKDLDEEIVSDGWILTRAQQERLLDEPSYISEMIEDK